MIERELHNGMQQHLAALAVNLQLAARLVETDRSAARALLEEMERDVQRALEDAARLAERVYPQRLESGGLVAALRAAALQLGSRISVSVTPDAGYPPEIARTVYLCCLAALERAGEGAHATVTAREESGTLVFEVVDDGAGSAGPEVELDRLRDRVEALGGRLTTLPDPVAGTRVTGYLPLSR